MSFTQWRAPSKIAGTNTKRTQRCLCFTLPAGETCEPTCTEESYTLRVPPLPVAVDDDRTHPNTPHAKKGWRSSLLGWRPLLLGAVTPPDSPGLGRQRPWEFMHVLRFGTSRSQHQKVASPSGTGGI